MSKFGSQKECEKIQTKHAQHGQQTNNINNGQSMVVVSKCYWILLLLLVFVFLSSTSFVSESRENGFFNGDIGASMNNKMNACFRVCVYKNHRNRTEGTVLILSERERDGDIET